MPFLQLRRALLAAACAIPLVLAACGGGGEDIVSEFQPTRMVAFGDAAADVGQRGVRYSVNGAGLNWTEYLAARYGLTLASSAAGGTSYAIGSARVATAPDAAGNAMTATVEQQITTFLAAGTLGAADLVVVNAGTADLIVEARAVATGAQAEAQAIANVQQAGRALGAQVKRLVAAGATHVAVVGPYNLGRSAWANNMGTTAFLEALSTHFNDQLKIELVDFGGTVLYVDAALYFNLVTSNPAGYGLNDAVTVACNSVDATAGIGIGAGQVSSALCTSGTVVADINVTLFADPIYFTPAGHTRFGDYAFERLRERW